MAKVLKLSLKYFNNASRDKREVSVLLELGYSVIVMAKENKNYIEKTKEGYEIHFRRIRDENAKGVEKQIQRVASVFSWISYIRELEPQCISCHNLSALIVGWMSTVFLSKNKKPKLVYDSHEFEIGRNTNGKRSKLSKLIVSKLEKFLMNKCAFSIMVNDSIADEVQKIHNLKERPIVVRNIPNYWDIDESVCKLRKQEFCELLGVPMDTFIIMYHGGVMSGRGIEMLLKVIQKNKNIAVVILGNGEKNYVEQLNNLVKKLQISERVLFHSAVKIEDLWQYVGAADIGMLTIPAVTKSYYFMLPNKFFENIQSLTPIIGSNFPEIKKIVNEYDIGLLVDPLNIDEIEFAIEQMRTNREMYNRFKKNLKLAKEDLCWENEKKSLLNAYNKII